jgi:PKD domain
MTRISKRTLLVSVTGIAGLAAAVALTLPAAALAWDWQSLPSGYGVSSYQTICHVSTDPCVNGEGSICNHVTITAPGTPQYQKSETDCVNPTFQADIDSFINATICTINPAAGQSQGMCMPTTTTSPQTTTGESTTPSPTTTTDQPTTTNTNGGGLNPPGAPVASFTTEASGLTVHFTDTSTATNATIATVTWHFGDGANGVGATTTHAFTASGDFTIIEIVTDSNGLASQASEQITVSPFGDTKTLAEKKSPSLGAAATSALGQTVDVYCVSSWGKTKPERGYGLSIVSSGQVNIWQAGCTALRTDKGPVGMALLVLGHESAHALGIKSEKTADCYSLRRIGLLEKALGVKDAGYRSAAAANVHHRWGRC